MQLSQITVRDCLTKGMTGSWMISRRDHVKKTFVTVSYNPRSAAMILIASHPQTTTPPVAAAVPEHWELGVWRQQCRDYTLDTIVKQCAQFPTACSQDVANEQLT